MKGIKRNISNIMAAASSAVAMMCISASCGMINEDLDPCPESAVSLRFVYDYNMEYANAFPNQVHCLSLFIFDSEGKLVARESEIDETRLHDENYRITLNLPAGEYRAVAYGGMECERTSFIHNVRPVSSLSDLLVSLHPDCLSIDSRRMLHNHFHGMKTFTVEENTTGEEKVEMMRNTNTVQVALQHVSGSPLSHEDFEFSITDDNTLFDCDNNLIPTGTATYRPYLTETKTAGAAEDDSELYAAVAHFNTSRIVHRKETPTTLTVTRKIDGDTVLSLPLANYMLLFKENHSDTAPMSDQEYLDRENSWQFVFFLDDVNDTWISTRIMVNNWLVRINNTGF